MHTRFRTRPGSRAWHWVAAFGVLAVAAAVIFGASGVAGSLTTAGLQAVGARPTAPHSVDPAIFDAPPATLPDAVTPAPVAEPAPAAAGTDPDAVAQHIARVGPAPGSVFGTVIDAGSGDAVYAANPDGSGTPASTMKLLTAAAVLSAYGADHRFVTQAVGDAADPARLWIVGGGDPALTRADLDELARGTAASLREDGVTRVELGVDAAVFAGDGWNPAWRPVYRDYVTPTEGLWVDRGRLTPNAVGPRSQQPALDAGRAFAAALTAQGIEVSGVRRSRAPADAAPRARVESAPLSRIVEDALAASDNDTMENLFRHVGRTRDGDGSIRAAQERLRGFLTEHGIWADQMVVSDGSGLSRDNRVAPSALAGAIVLAASDDQPDLRPVLTGMPVAGAAGTLLNRFVTEGTEAGRGVVRGKTGTLTGVSSLAGYVRDRDGAILVYAFLVNGDGSTDYQAREYLDRVSSALAACGCR